MTCEVLPLIKKCGDSAAFLKIIRGAVEMRRTPLALAISIALASGSVLISNPVLAQDDQSAETDTIEEIITTGSRIRKDVFTSSAPMDVIDMDKASVLGIATL